MDAEDLRKIVFEEEYNRQCEHEARESLELIREYGIQAWYDLSALKSYKDAQEVLNRIVKTLIRIEQYEDIKFVEDLVPLFNETSVTTSTEAR